MWLKTLPHQKNWLKSFLTYILCTSKWAIINSFSFFTTFQVYKFFCFVLTMYIITFKPLNNVYHILCYKSKMFNNSYITELQTRRKSYFQQATGLMPEVTWVWESNIFRLCLLQFVLFFCNQNQIILDLIRINKSSQTRYQISFKIYFNNNHC